MESTAGHSSASSSGLSIRTKLTILVALLAIFSVTLIFSLKFAFTYDSATEQFGRPFETLSHDGEMRQNAYVVQQKERLNLITKYSGRGGLAARRPVGYQRPKFRRWGMVVVIDEPRDQTAAFHSIRRREEDGCQFQVHRDNPMQSLRLPMIAIMDTAMKGGRLE